MTTPAPPTSIERVLRASQLLGGLDPALLADLSRRTVRRALGPGERLWREGDAATHFTLILSGLLKMVRVAPDGSESIIALFGPRESAGDPAVLEGGRYPADAVAASALEVLRIEASPLQAALAQAPPEVRAMNRALLAHVRALHDKIKVMSAGTVPQRLATLLLHLADRFGDEMPDGTTLIPVQLSRGELARIVSATVETTIRTMSRWQKAKLLSTGPRGFVVYELEALVRITRGVRSSG